MIDILIARVAGSQCGLFSRQQWLDIGGDDDGISWRLQTGALTDEGVGVYGLPGWPDTFHRSVWRVILIAGPHAAASSWTAAALHELWPFPEGRLTLSVPHGDHHRPGLAFVSQPRDLTEDQIVLVHGLRATSIPRTFCDLAAVCSRERLRVGLEHAHGSRKARISETADLYERLRKKGKPGFKLLGQVLETRRDDFWIPPTELERMFKRLIRKHGIAEPEWQAPLPWSPTRRADGIWWPARVVLELDSRSFHARTDQMSSDRRRDRMARRNGFTPCRIMYEEVKYEPHVVVSDVRELLAAPPAASGGHSTV